MLAPYSLSSCPSFIFHPKSYFPQFPQCELKETSTIPQVEIPLFSHGESFKRLDKIPDCNSIFTHYKGKKDSSKSNWIGLGTNHNFHDEIYKCTLSLVKNISGKVIFYLEGIEKGTSYPCSEYFHLPEFPKQHICIGWDKPSYSLNIMKLLGRGDLEVKMKMKNLLRNIAEAASKAHNMKLFHEAVTAQFEKYKSIRNRSQEEEINFKTFKYVLKERKKGLSYGIIYETYSSHSGQVKSPSLKQLEEAKSLMKKRNDLLQLTLLEHEKIFPEFKQVIFIAGSDHVRPHKDKSNIQTIKNDLIFAPGTQYSIYTFNDKKLKSTT